MKTQPEVIEIDICGQVCPSSLLLVLREVNARHEDLMSGECQMLVSTDNRDATGTIPDTVESMGFVAEVVKKGPCYQILIKHNENDLNGAL